MLPCRIDIGLSHIVSPIQDISSFATKVIIVTRDRDSAGSNNSEKQRIPRIVVEGYESTIIGAIAIWGRCRENHITTCGISPKIGQRKAATFSSVYPVTDTTTTIFLSLLDYLLHYLK